LVELISEEEAREMEGSESKSASKSVKKKCKYCMCKSYIVRLCELKSSESKLVDLLVLKVGSDVQLKK